MERLALRRLASRARSIINSSLGASSHKMSTSPSSTPGPMERSIREKLTVLFQPTELAVTNDSERHRHHAAMRVQGGGNGETHFTVNVVSEAFKGQTTLNRHRMVNAALAGEFKEGGLHALSVNAKTPEEVPPVSPE